MLRNLLVALDGSTDSDAAVTLAIRWAARFRGSAIGLGIVDTPEILKRESTPPGTTEFKRRRDEALLADARTRVEEFLVRFAARCEEAGVPHESVVEEGDPREQIVHQAQRCDLILMGLHGNFHFATSDRADSTLADVVRDCPRPVVAVPATPPAGDGVLVAYDGSLQAARALATFVATGLGCERQVRLVCVHHDEDQAREILSPACAYLEAHEIEPSLIVNTEASRDPAAAIAELTNDPGVGLLVLGAYGRPRLYEFFLGSVTRSLLDRGSRPLFLYH